MTPADLIEEAKHVLAGKTRSHVKAAADLAAAYLVVCEANAALESNLLQLRATIRRLDPASRPDDGERLSEEAPHAGAESGD